MPLARFVAVSVCRMMIVSTAAAVAGLALLATGPAIAQTGAAHDLAPYVATYELTFGRHGRSAVSGGRARMTVEITGGRCTQYKLVRTMSGTLNGDHGAMSISSENVITENAAGTQLAVSITERANGKITRQETAIARRDADGTINVRSTRLGANPVALPQKALLPMAQERMVVRALAAGRPNLSVAVYNPELGLTAIDRIAYTIAPAVTTPVDKSHPAALPSLRNVSRHPITMTMSNAKTGKTRVIEKQIRFVNNVFSVADSTVLDSMTIKARMLSLKMLPPPCP